MHELNEDPDLFTFPELPDEAAIAINDFIEAFYTRFQNHYFAQLHRYCHDRRDPSAHNDPIAAPLNDPPF